jgi:predicted phage tail protein
VRDGRRRTTEDARRPALTPGDHERVTLSEDERRALEELEVALRSCDPAWVSIIEGAPPRLGGGCAVGVVLLVVGAAGMVATFVRSLVLALVAAAVMGTGFGLLAAELGALLKTACRLFWLLVTPETTSDDPPPGGTGQGWPGWPL